jgi:hypothetical protein
MADAWPAHLEGACYTRDDGWFRPLRQPDGKIHREPIPAAEIRAAGLDEHPAMQDGQGMLFLQSQPPQNLIPRREAAVRFPTYHSAEEAQESGEAFRARLSAAIDDYRERSANGDTSNPPFRTPADDPGPDPGWFTPEEQP